MEYSADRVREEQLQQMPINQFIDTYHPGFTFQGIRNVIKRDLIDYVKYPKGKYNVYFIVLTLRTFNWKPCKHRNRDVKNI